MQNRHHNSLFFSSLPKEVVITCDHDRAIALFYQQITSGCFCNSRLPQVRKFRGKGFTLMEIVVTLGIFAMFIGAFGLFPQLVSISGESAFETRAAHIARQIVNDLIPSVRFLAKSSTPETGGVDSDGTPVFPAAATSGVLIKAEANDDVSVLRPDLMSKGLYTVHYDLNGKAVFEFSAEARLKVEVIIHPVISRAGFCEVEIQIRRLNGSASVEPFRFVTKVSYPRKETKVTS